ncbi:type II toxin-antitoxin system RatA family toxin [Chitinilyticum piscinae]|uniref:SRPBCC family protein n=1 Tax=Chitinilyticum piscinae TaxID=2866724 RepID=A0A8J7FZA4_9NEIS|nr:SRPBCC family protein [Chitinilyticum piscinae]MBE9608438.1 SRPBCC family protein [Chitinilyticum piscinae]
MKIRYDFEVNASAEALFALTQDYALRARWDPLTKEAYLVDASEPCAGALVRCTAHNGLSMDTVYVSYKPNAVAAVKLVKGPYVFDQFAGGWQFREISPNRTMVRFSYHLTTKPKWLSWLLTPVLGYQFKRETRKRIRALTDYAEQHYAAKA